MPARIGRGALAAAGYALIATAFAWPLPLRLGSALLGTRSGDTGVYVWNLWLFRHLIVAHHAFPFFTIDILSLTPRVPLTLHNYTALADVLAFPLLPVLGTVATFNLLTLASGVLAACAMFVLARRLTGDTAAAWVAGLAFGFSPFMSARATEHFSLIQTAPLVTFALFCDNLRLRPTIASAAGAGISVALAYFCDPYYAVYCVLIGAFSFTYAAVAVSRAPATDRPYRWRMALDAMVAVNLIVIACMAVWGGWRFTLMGVRVSMTQFYTPVLVLTVLAVARLWLAFRPRISWMMPTLPPLRTIVAAGVACVFFLSPVLSAMGSHVSDRRWISPRVWWRSSAAGLDFLGLFVPNPLHPWFGGFFHDGIARMPGGFVENVGSVPWVLIATLVAAWAWARTRMPRYWVAFTVFFALLTLGPFVRIAGFNTYVPTPWALLRYVPVVGAARVPTRMMVLVMFGLSVVLAFALSALRARVRRPGLLAAAVAGLLLVEMLPAPRTLYSAEIPSIFRTIAADPRPVRVTHLPFGLRDGLTSYGNTNAAAQFFQTVHEKPLVGGYMSRLPGLQIEYYQSRRVTRGLIDLSEGREILEPRRTLLVERARRILPELNIGYVVVDTDRAPAALVDFAREAFSLTFVESSGKYALYRTPLAPPPPRF